MGTFRQQLADSQVQIDDQLDKMLRKHEAGDSLTYGQLGTTIFRRVNGTGNLNRIDKISTVETWAGAEDVAQPSFSNFAHLTKRKGKFLDSLQKDEELRNASGVYAPKRGGGVQPKKDVFGSNLFHILNHDQSRQTGGDREYVASFRNKNTKMQTSDGSVYNWGAPANDGRMSARGMSADLMSDTASVSGYESARASKRRFTNHRSQKSNGDLITHSYE